MHERRQYQRTSYEVLQMCRPGGQVHSTCNSQILQKFRAVENDRFNMAPSRRKTSESFCYPDVPPRHAVHNAAENPAPLFCHEPAVGILYATLLSA
ncbi:hypothetical protein M0657_006284 [Pyricularia oryzae]|uniref:Uncharacterized protein n=2 Tax=Pyricularia oryzae TaxID=318829 RepID=A0AA97PL87_PYRO3|nr:hypothetical protein OOU_Y34scaffold00528g44 [Pyricularia oryzae Y34]KAI7921026.1 hypothetical protein M0657_006284 [Pyricularia oryzae]KAI7926612.1 hypothetical protein M9X92_002626 [Pyricularia oryzae]